MQGVDISHWDEPFDFRATACDFAIIKLTQGHTHIDECAVQWIHECIELGKPFGVYHYIDGSGFGREAEHFTECAKDYIGKGIIALDWEAKQNKAWGNEAYLASLTEKVVELTGVAPFIYASFAAFPHKIAEQYGCPKWIARYRNMRETGYQDTPWKESEVTCEIRQYTENGRLASHDGALDLDKAYFEADQWAKYVNPSGNAVNYFNSMTAAFAVIKGEYGNGKERRARLGTHYSEVQAIVNRIYNEAHNAVKGKYGNGAARHAALDDDYEMVQYLINKGYVRG